MDRDDKVCLALVSGLGCLGLIIKLALYAGIIFACYAVWKHFMG